MDPTSCRDNGTDVYTDATAKVVASISITIGTLGLIGNLLVFVAVSLSKKLHTKTNVFVVCLAISDFITAITLPLQGVGVLSGNEWPLAEWTCTLVSFITVLSNPSSILTLTAIAINRYIFITKPKYLYQRIYTPAKITGMLLFIWVFSFLVCVLPQLIPATGGLVYDPCFRTCIWDLNHPMAHASEAATAIAFFICGSIISFCYFRIYQFVHSHMARTQMTLQSAMQINITKNMACVVVVFFICTMPYSIYLFTKTRSIEGAFLILLVVLPVCLNPVIYAAKHPVFKEIFKCMLCCKCKKIPEPTCLKSGRYNIR